MGLFRMAAVGAIGYVAYRALQRRQAGTDPVRNVTDDTASQRLTTGVSDTASPQPDTSGSTRTEFGNATI